MSTESEKSLRTASWWGFVLGVCFIAIGIQDLLKYRSTGQVRIGTSDYLAFGRDAIWQVSGYFGAAIVFLGYGVYQRVRLHEKGDGATRRFSGRPEDRADDDKGARTPPDT